MPNTQGVPVAGLDGLKGTLASDLRAGGDDPVRIRIEGGPTIEVPSSIVRRREDGTYCVPISPADLDRAGAESKGSGSETVIPVLAEELSINKEAVPTGGVRVHRRTFEHEEAVDVPLSKDHVDVSRVLIDREVDGPLPVRREGDETIIPIVEEVLVVEKRYRLKEEIHVSRTTSQERHREKVTVKRQEAEVERLDAEGKAVASRIPLARREEPGESPFQHKKVLNLDP